MGDLVDGPLILREATAWLLALIGFLLLGAFARADNADDTEREPSSESRAQQAQALDRALHRLYPGGRDEQDLKPQAELPTPSRTIDGSAVPTAADAREPAPD
jgi:hypothetical protein